MREAMTKGPATALVANREPLPRCATRIQNIIESYRLTRAFDDSLTAHRFFF